MPELYLTDTVHKLCTPITIRSYNYGPFNCVGFVEVGVSRTKEMKFGLHLALVLSTVFYTLFDTNKKVNFHLKTAFLL